MAEKGAASIIGLIIGGVVIAGLLILIIIPLSFSYLEYDEMGFRRQKSTGSVDTSHVYTNGRHLIGPDFEFKVFKASAHRMEFNNVAIFTADRLEITISLSCMYFLRKEDLKLLHDSYDIFYEAILKTNALDALKGASTVFTTDQFIAERKKVEAALFAAVRDRISGQCCLPDCEENGDCLPGCEPRSGCTTKQKGLFATVKYFYFAEVGIPSEINKRYLRALTLQEDAATEKFNQNATIVRTETDVMVNQIKNEANEIAQNATAQSKLIGSKSRAEAMAIKEKARSDGLNHLYSELGITTQEHKASFDYLRSLKEMSGAHLYVDFQQLITGPGKL